MTHPPDRIPSLPSHARTRGWIPRLALLALAASGWSLAWNSPALAGTALWGKVTLPNTIPAKAGETRGTLDTVSMADVVVYVTEKPGGTRLASRAKRRDIELKGERFEPLVQAVTTGSKVRFQNRDALYHSLFSVTPAGRSEIGILAPGQRREVRFDHPGVSNLFCQLHSSAAGFVVVCPNWFYARPNPAGEYKLPSLPRGSYLVHVWHPRFGETQRSIDVTGRDVRRLDLSL